MWTVASAIANSIQADADVRHLETTADSSAASVWKLVVAIAAYLRFLAILLFRRPDVVHVHFASGYSIVRKLPFINAACRMGVPVLAHHHGGAFTEFIGAEDWRVHAARRALKRTMLIAVIDERSMSLLSNWLGLPNERFVLLPNTVVVPTSVSKRRTQERDSLTFLYVGRLSIEKGVDDLLEAFAGMADQMPRASLIVAGDGSQLDVLLASSRGLRVDFLGRVTAEDRDNLLDRCDVFVLPSHVENVPLALMEAMAYGLPVVATRVGGVPDMVENGSSGLIVEAGDVVGMRQAMVRCAEDGSLRRALGRAARVRAASFDRRALRGHVLCAYRRLVVEAMEQEGEGYGSRE
jgi:glycosyltransferase involved in cell wall biosynthesis